RSVPAVRGMPIGKLLPGPAAAHARGLLGHDVRARLRVLVAGLDQDPAVLAGAGQADPPASLCPCRGNDRPPGSSRAISAPPSSQMITAPLPRGCPSCTPSKSPAARS